MAVLRSGLIYGYALLLAAHGWYVTAAEQDPEEAYTQAIAGRATKIVGALGLTSHTKIERVEQLIASQYRNLRSIHDARDAKLESLAKSTAENAAEKRDQLTRQADLDQFRLHRQFVAELSVELTPEQVDGVKNGMTYGVVPVTYAAYLEKIPNLKEAERKKILALLIEAREYAMDAGSAEEKHGWFRKYKGKITNYLSQAGYVL